jgi:O-antigen ligase
MSFYKSIQNIPEKVNSYLIIALIFFIPFSTAAGSILSAIILLFWLIHGRFKEQYRHLKSNKVVIVSLMIVVMHVIGLLWTSDLDWGLHTLKKQWKFLMIPVFMLYIKKEHMTYYFYAFVLAMSLSELVSYGIWFELIDPFKSATVYNPTPFLTHIVYNPFLAIAIYLIASELLFCKHRFNYKQWLYLLFLITMTVNMFITGGRSGQAMMFLAIIILSLQYFGIKNMIKSMSISIMVLIGIFYLAYNFSSIFYERVNLTVSNVLYYDQNKNSSVGKRITFALNGLDVFSENMIVGVGTGDLPSAMKEKHQLNTPEVAAPDNPHNMYIMWLVQFGVFGFLMLVLLFYIQIKVALLHNNQSMKRLGVALPLLFILANFGESYLSIHATSILFTVFSAIIYSDNFHKDNNDSSI